MAIIKQEIISRIEALSKEPYPSIKKDIIKMSDEEQESTLDGTIRTLAELQRDAVVVNQMYEEAILNQNIKKAIEIGVSAGFKNLPGGNPKIFNWLSNKTRLLADRIISRVNILKVLENYIKGYPLQSIQLDLSITPKVSLTFQRRVKEVI